MVWEEPKLMYLYQPSQKIVYIVVSVSLSITHYKTPPLRNLCLKLCHVYVPEWRPRQQLFFSFKKKNIPGVLFTPKRGQVMSTCFEVWLPLFPLNHLTCDLQRTGQGLVRVSPIIDNFSIIVKRSKGWANPWPTLDNQKITITNPRILSVCP